MAVSIVEFATGTASTTATPTAALTTTPAAGDVIVAVLVGGQNASTFTSASGCGATWTAGYVPTGSSTGQRMFIIGTGATSSGTVTLTVSASRNCFLHLYLIRGLTSTTVTGVDSSASSAMSFVGTSQTADSGQIVIGAVRGNMTTAGQMTSPSSGALPSSGAWTGHSVITNSFLGSGATSTAIPGSSGTYAIDAATSGTAGSFNISQIVLGTAAASSVTVSAPVLTTTTDVLDPTVSVAAAGVTVTAPVLTTTTALPAPTVSSVTPVTVSAPLLTTTTDALDPTVSVSSGAVTVAAPLLAATTDLLDPTVSVVTTAGTVSAPTLTTTTALRAPLVISGALVSTSMTAHGGGTADITATFNVTPTTMRASGGGRAAMSIPRTHINDPRTGLPQYQLRVVDDNGTPIADIALKATMDVLEEKLQDPTGFGFTLPTLDPKAALVTPTEGSRPPTVQLRRGQYHAAWVDITRAVPSSDGATTTYQCVDRRWTLEREHIGKSPQRNLIRNGDFSEGDKYGTYGWDAKSTPEAAPLHSVVEDDFSSSGYALELTGADKSQLIVEDVATAAVFVPNSATYLSGGEAIIQAAAANIPNGSTIRLTGHTANNSINGDYGDGLTLSLNRAIAAKGTLAAMGKGFVFELADTSKYAAGTFVTGSQCVGRGFYSPVASNATEAGQAKNRRVSIGYEGVSDGTQSAQWREVSAVITHDASKRRPLTVTAAGESLLMSYLGPNRDNVSVKLTLAKASTPNTILKTETVAMDGPDGSGSYVGSEVSLDVPADGVAYLLRAYYYAPHGTIRWIDIGLYPDDVLGFYGVDQALIVKAFIEHAQDPEMGRATLNLATNCRLTGMPRTREYRYRDRMPIAAAVEEFPSLNRGVDIDLVTTATTRTVTTFYPRQGDIVDEVLALGRNVVRYEAPVDLTQVSTSVVVQADSLSAHRQEGHAVNASRLGGMILEDIVKAEKETPYRDLQGAAVDRLTRYGGPFPLLSVECDPRWTSNLLDTVRKGDVVRVIINDGRTNIDGPFRVVARRLDPNTDALSYQLSQEV